MSRMAKCTFEREPKIDLLWAAQGPDQAHLHPILNSTISAETCSVAEGAGVWHFTRIGPFHTVGGDSWTGFQTLHDNSVYPFWRVSNDGQQAWLSVSDHVLGSVDRAGELIGYPPIHQHHWHYAPASNPAPEMLSTHGDFECTGGQGVYCLLVEYPNSSAFELVPQINLFAEFNDVRPIGSAQMEWFALGGIFVHDPSMSRPERMSWATVGAPQMNTGLGPRGTSVLDSELEGVSWSTGTIPFVDHIVDSYFHGHPDMIDDLWFIRASPAQLGLLSPPWITAFSAFQSGATAISQLKAHLRRVIHDTGADLVCRYNQFPHLERDSSNPPGKLLTRRTPCIFEREVHGALQWTFVSFFKAQTRGLPRKYPMHSVLRVAYHTKAARWDYSRVRSDDCASTLTLDYWNHDADVFLRLPFLRLPFSCLQANVLSDGLFKGDGWLLATEFLYPLTLSTFWSAPLFVLGCSAALTLCFARCFGCHLCRLVEVISIRKHGWLQVADQAGGRDQ